MNIRKILPYRFLSFLRIIKKGLLFKHKKCLKQSKMDRLIKPSELPYYLSIAVIVKNEVSYIAEWIEYHLLIGVQKFYIYDNESTDDLKSYLEPYIKSGIVEYTFFPGKRQQMNVYKDAVERLKYSSFWIAFIDIDEYFVPVSTNTLTEFLHDFEDVPGLEINQLIYGSNGHKFRQEGLVLERFKSHANYNDEFNKLVKSIVNPRYIFFMASPHEAEYFIGDYSVNSHKNKNLNKWAEREPLFDKLYFNHYGCKSYEELEYRIGLGRASSDGKLSPTREIKYRDKNEIKNDTIMDKYIEIIKNNIFTRFNN